MSQITMVRWFVVAFVHVDVLRAARLGVQHGLVGNVVSMPAVDRRRGSDDSDDDVLGPGLEVLDAVVASVKDPNIQTAAGVLRKMADLSFAIPAPPANYLFGGALVMVASFMEKFNSDSDEGMSNEDISRQLGEYHKKMEAKLDIIDDRLEALHKNVNLGYNTMKEISGYHVQYERELIRHPDAALEQARLAARSRAKLYFWQKTNVEELLQLSYADTKMPDCESAYADYKRIFGSRLALFTMKSHVYMVDYKEVDVWLVNDLWTDLQDYEELVKKYQVPLNEKQLLSCQDRREKEKTYKRDGTFQLSRSDKSGYCLQADCVDCPGCHLSDACDFFGKDVFHSSIRTWSQSLILMVFIDWEKCDRNNPEQHFTMHGNQIKVKDPSLDLCLGYYECDGCRPEHFVGWSHHFATTCNQKLLQTHFALGWSQQNFSNGSNALRNAWRQKQSPVFARDFPFIPVPLSS